MAGQVPLAPAEGGHTGVVQTGNPGRAAGGAPAPATIEVLLDEVHRAVEHQVGTGTALDQASGIVTGFAGVVVTVLVGGDGLWTAVAAGLAALSAVCGVRAMAVRTTVGLHPATLVERYLAGQSTDASLAILATTTLLHEHRADRLRSKRRWFTMNAWLLVAAVAVLVATITVEATAPQHQDSLEEAVTSDA